ncbi:hypothetical protein MPLSOD_100105 [Mesorhizobium sp. SOD10]|nr:hypothetical protein MPLSOD_100105 [Mesorhizobium sp. SOD10]
MIFTRRFVLFGAKGRVDRIESAHALVRRAKICQSQERLNPLVAGAGAVAGSRSDAIDNAAKSVLTKREMLSRATAQQLPSNVQPQ